MPVALLCVVLVLVGGRARAEQQLPTYPGVPHTRIGNDLVIGGGHYRLAYFRTRDPMRQVGRYFLRQWEEQGYPTTTDGRFEEEGVVSAYYTREGLVRSVVLRRHRGETVGLVVLRDLWTRASAPAVPGLVQPEGALYSQDVAVHDGPGSGQHRSSLLPLGLPDAREALVRELGGAGFRLVREGQVEAAGGRRLVLEHARDGAQVLSVLVELEPGLSALAQSVAASDRGAQGGGGASGQAAAAAPPHGGEGR